MKQARSNPAATVIAAALAATTLAAVVCPASAAPPPGYRLVWRDAFHGPPGSAPDPAVWSFDDGPVYNHELEHYVSDRAHCRIVADPQATDGSALQITATSTDGRYESARINTLGKYSVQYGYIEVRCKLPSGQGMWPAFWMLGADEPTVGWPRCGEIDIMENIGREPATNHGSLHMPQQGGPTPWSQVTVSSAYALPRGALSDSYHTYGLLWKPGVLVFDVDGHVYETVHRADAPADAVWEYDSHPFYLILNLAVGGTWPGAPNATTRFPQSLRVDSIRVYEPAASDGRGSR